MRRALAGLHAWSYDLLWYLSDLRAAQPRRFTALITLLAGLLIVTPVLALTLSGGGERGDAEHASARAVRSESVKRPRYVPYNGLAASGSAQPLGADSREAEADAPDIVVRKLSEVLRGELQEAELIYGSDGAEGGILPIDNGVTPSSGPRFDTTWEIIVPSAKIQAAVVQVGLTAGGAMGSPDNPFVFGWFNRSAAPGEPGNALLGGHRDYEDIDGNVGVGVGWELDETRVGDQLILRNAATDRYYVYDVVEVATVRPESPGATRYLSQTRESVVTLITCAGEFDEATHSYAERIVIVALLTAVAEPDA